jgi:hypothetical protein
VRARTGLGGLATGLALAALAAPASAARFTDLVLERCRGGENCESTRIARLAEPVGPAVAEYVIPLLSLPACATHPVDVPIPPVQVPGVGTVDICTRPDEIDAPTDLVAVTSPEGARTGLTYETSTSHVGCESFARYDLPSSGGATTRLAVYSACTSP